MDLLVIGLDGLSYNMIDRFDVSLPQLDRVRSAGPSGDLWSTDTPTTIPAWTSFATGKDPGTHGIRTMTTQHADYSTAPARTNTSDAAIYDFLDDSLFVNLPASVGRVPAADGSHVVSAMLASDEADAVPEPLQSLSAFDDYVLDHDASLKVRPGKYFEHVCEITRRRGAFAREAFETYDPRVGFVLFSTPDWAGHVLSNVSGEERRGDLYRDLLNVVNECTASLTTMADNVVLMSDHGFEHKHTNVHLNGWLAAEGYLRQRTGGSAAEASMLSAVKSVASKSDTVYSLLRKVYNRIIGTSVGERLTDAARFGIDHAASVAWQHQYGCVYVNDERFDAPVVEDPTPYVAELRGEISTLTDADGDPLFREVLTAAEAYNDPTDDAPDVIARPASGCFPTSLKAPTGGYHSPTDNFEHRYRGIFAATGPLFVDEGTPDGMSIVDVLPTLLHALGEPLAPDFDGSVRTDLLRTDREPTTMAAADVPSPQARSATGSESDREDVVEERLSDLGYIE